MRVSGAYQLFRTRVLLLWILLAVSGCSSLMVETRSHASNPLGWPARGLATAGLHSAATGVPVVRECGRLLQGLAELIDAPALLVEAALTLDGQRLAASAERLVLGVGGSVTATLNLPASLSFGLNVDIGKQAEAINDALRHLEQLSIEEWRFFPGDERTEIFPAGTRVRAWGNHLVWELGDGVQILQVAEGSLLFWSTNIVGGTEFAGQERSWGFVVPRRSHWEARSRRHRAVTTIHEFYHQYQQLRRRFRGWTTLYWPAYGTSFLRHGWMGHWAEMQGPFAAGVVDRGLRGWTPPPLR